MKQSGFEWQLAEHIAADGEDKRWRQTRLERESLYLEK